MDESGSALAHKATATAHFKGGRFAEAAAEYRRGASKLRPALGAAGDEAAAAAAAALSVTLHTNAAICFIKLGEWEEAIGSSTKAIKLTTGGGASSSSKALFQRAKAYRGSTHRANGLTLARADLRAAIKLEPKSKPLRSLMVGPQRLLPLQPRRRCQWRARM